ncbi:DUF4829 domain-containing protein [Anaerobacillus alkalidiazotrophicus]|uniref:DUF4829 domain-containing protein n=1 Tax=Anaerobacillus alkalidiazotrophicus TaxID=472963 RepID=A0A1S2M815_9BACI|nr:DUF4829 domain-containing protein [Anaerobacillus alkalidiazotrophicus]OIJ20726.1 DUF4829 domain-containing protein [Anaerobacillus alkalidiazotrophicus]
MKKTIFSLCLIIVFGSIVFYNQFGKTNNVQVSIEESIKFSEEEINEAVVAVKKKIKDFKGCKLTDLWYSENKSNEFIDGYLKYGKGSSNGITEENVIVLLSNFEVNSRGGDGSLEPNSIYSDWNWILVRDNNSDNWRVDNWRVDDWGY